MNIMMIGCGGVGRTLLEMWKLEKQTISLLIIIEPRDIPEWCFKMYPNIQHIQKALDKNNLKKILLPILRKEKPFVVDVSVDVDAIKIMELCKMEKCNYINTSVEGWEEKNPQILNPDPKALIKRSLFERENQAEKAIGNSKTTMLTNQGANPGLISQLVMKGLNDYVEKKGDKHSKKLLKNKEFNKLAHYLGLEEIHISEIDTQKSLKPRPKGYFFNTWSCIGFQAEALDPVQIGNGSNRKGDDDGATIVGNMRIYPIRGMDITCSSKCIGLDGETIDIQGMLIPHAEADSLSDYLTDKEYRPSVFYVYQCGKDAMNSLNEVRKNGYNPIDIDKCYVLENKDIEAGGYDSLGALLIFKNNCIWWCGSVLSIEEARRLGFKHTAPTTIQVAISMINAINYINRNKKQGLIEPEDLDWRMMIDQSKKYLGKIFSKEL